MKKELLDAIQASDRIRNMYEIGPVQKAEVEMFIADIIELCAGIVETAAMHDLPKESFGDLLREELDLDGILFPTPNI